MQLTFEAQKQNTNYTARVRHWTIADREAHEEHSGYARRACRCPCPRRISREVKKTTLTKTVKSGRVEVNGIQYHYQIRGQGAPIFIRN